MNKIINFIILILLILITIQLFNTPGQKYIKLKNISNEEKEKKYNENIFSYDENEYVKIFFDGIIKILKEDNDIRYKYINKESYNNHLEIYPNKEYNKKELFISSSYNIIQKYKYNNINKIVIQAVLFKKTGNVSMPLNAEYYYIERKGLFDYKLKFNENKKEDIYDNIME